MAVQYPHIITFKLNENPAPTFTDGEWVFSDEGSEDLALKCRAESNTNGSTVGTASGEAINYSYTVYMEKLSIEIPYGTKCTLTMGDVTFEDMNVKWVSKGQFNTRIWL